MLNLQGFNSCRLQVVTENGSILDLGRIKTVLIDRPEYIYMLSDIHEECEDPIYSFIVDQTDSWNPISINPDEWENILQGDVFNESEQSDV